MSDILASILMAVMLLTLYKWAETPNEFCDDRPAFMLSYRQADFCKEAARK
jgi:hypothetical protein